MAFVASGFCGLWLLWLLAFVAFVAFGFCAAFGLYGFRGFWLLCGVWLLYRCRIIFIYIEISTGLLVSNIAIFVYSFFFEDSSRQNLNL